MRFFLFLLISITCFAEEDVRKNRSHPCFMDFPLHCKDSIPGDKDHWQCLGNRMSMLSDKCSAFMKEVYEKKSVCGKDVLTFCPGKLKNYENWKQCLDSRRHVLSSKCRTILENKEKRERLYIELPKICQNDMAKYCRDLAKDDCLGLLSKLPLGEIDSKCKKAFIEYKETY